MAAIDATTRAQGRGHQGEKLATVHPFQLRLPVLNMAAPAQGKLSHVTGRRPTLAQPPRAPTFRLTNEPEARGTPSFLCPPIASRRLPQDPTTAPVSLD